jgi:hypothetical protein
LSQLHLKKNSFYFSCRWAKTTSKLDECLDICGIIPGGTLNSDNCTLIFNSTGKTVGDYYAVALMVEDFLNASINTSLSSVPIQFLIEIDAPPYHNNYIRMFEYNYS